MKWTGERLVTHVDEFFTFEHLHRYYLAAGYVADRVVLDVACGEGYGAALLAKTAMNVVGVDLSPETVLHAQKTYTSSNLEFKTGDVRKLDLDADAFDVVTCFETIEHVLEHEQVVSEVARVLKPDGLLIISTPDAHSSHHLASNGNNPFHPKELSKDEFETLLKKYFRNVQFYYQKTVSASLLVPDGPAKGELLEYQGSFDGFSEHKPDKDAQYFVCVCSQNQLPPQAPPSLLTYMRKIKTVTEKILIKIRNAFRS